MTADTQLGLCLFFITTAVQPLKRDGHSQQIENLEIHRSFCSWAFYLLFIALTLHTLPPFVYTLAVHHPPPLPLDWVPVARTISLLGAWIAAGCMRRGPKMAYEPPRLGTGFGLSRDPKKSVVAEVGEEESNVFDRANCALFDFCLLTYVSLPFSPFIWEEQIVIWMLVGLIALVCRYAAQKHVCPFSLAWRPAVSR